VASVGSYEAELQRVLYTRLFVFAAQADEADAVVYALCTIGMAHIQHDALLPTIEQKPAQSNELGARDPS